MKVQPNHCADNPQNHRVIDRDDCAHPIGALWARNLGVYSCAPRRTHIRIRRLLGQEEDSRSSTVGAVYDRAYRKPTTPIHI
jgi:hypothetical protein